MKNTKLKQDNIVHKKKKLMESELGGYFNFVIDNVAEIMGIEREVIMTGTRVRHVVLARYLIVEIIHNNTKVGPDVMYLINLDRTTYYNRYEKLEEMNKSYIDKILYSECVSRCSMAEYERIHHSEKADN